MIIERWRAKRNLPGAKRELQTQACLLSDVNGPKLLVVMADEQYRSDAAQLFDNFCQAIQVSYGLTKDTAGNAFPAVPTLLFASAELQATAESLLQLAPTFTQELSAGLHNGSAKSAWWQSLSNAL